MIGRPYLARDATATETAIMAYGFFGKAKFPKPRGHRTPFTSSCFISSLSVCCCIEIGSNCMVVV